LGEACNMHNMVKPSVFSHNLLQLLPELLFIVVLQIDQMNRFPLQVLQAAAAANASPCLISQFKRPVYRCAANETTGAGDEDPSLFHLFYHLLVTKIVITS